jgi:hypothetical protein
MKVKLQKIIEQEVEVSEKREEDLTLLADARKEAEEAIEKAKAEIETLEMYSGLPEPAKAVLARQELVLGKEYLGRLAKRGAKVGQLYQEVEEKKEFSGPVEVVHVLKRGSGSDGRYVPKFEKGPAYSKIVKRFDSIAETGIPLVKECMKEKAKGLVEKIQALRESVEVPEILGTRLLLTYQVASEKKEQVQAAGEEVIGFLKGYLARLEEIQAKIEEGLYKEQAVITQRESKDDKIRIT